MRTLSLLLLAAAGLAAQDSPDRWRIHEWGTFTVLQDESGRPIGWINTEDEPVPPFVHRLSRDLLVPVDDLAPAYFKDTPRSHPDVIVRLETPVVYFHPPARAKLPVKVDLRVDFRGGWLTEHYPKAVVGAPGLKGSKGGIGRLRPDTNGFLDWKGLQVGREGTFPETKDAVWLAPRNVKAAPITAAGGESERFLFYRGVGYFQAPIMVERNAETISLHPLCPPGIPERAPMKVPKLWYADIREDGRTAFRALPGVEIKGHPALELARIPSEFAEADYAVARLGELRADMKAGLVADGLYADEADALLNTWDASYFRSHGRRLFFLLPRAWTDYVLPLRTSLQADIVRSMVGRIELVTPAQRKSLRTIAASTSSSSEWYQQWASKNPDALRRFEQKRQEGNLQALRAEQVEIPANYRAYLELGRFRNALLLSELKQRPTPGLKAFVDAYDLHEAAVGDE